MMGIIVTCFALKCVDLALAAGIDRLGDNIFSNKQGVE